MNATAYANDIRRSCGLHSTPCVFSNEEDARNFASRIVVGAAHLQVVLGDFDSLWPYWVVVPSDAARLEAAGYEILK